MTTDTMLRDLTGNSHPYLMKAGIHQLEVLPSAMKQRKKRKDRPFSSLGPNYFPFPVPEGEASLSIFCVSFTNSPFVSSGSLLSVAKRIIEDRRQILYALRYEEARE